MGRLVAVLGFFFFLLVHGVLVLVLVIALIVLLVVLLVSDDKVGKLVGVLECKGDEHSCDWRAGDPQARPTQFLATHLFLIVVVVILVLLKHVIIVEVLTWRLDGHEIAFFACRRRETAGGLGLRCGAGFFNVL